jgi:hypothetical protein
MAGMLGLAQPAAAHDDAAAAVAAGILGLGMGAAIASDHPHYRRHYYYTPPPPVAYFASPPVYYYGPPPRRPYYGYYGQCGWGRCWQSYIGMESLRVVPQAIKPRKIQIDGMPGNDLLEARTEEAFQSA